MTDKTRLSCFLIGADSLLVECGEILRNAGHEIRGVISAAPRIAAWAEQHGLALVEPQQIRAALGAAPFDYLFAITHLEVLPADVLAFPARGTINFHDGALPRYAGLNAPAWAIFNGETSYGITWHFATETIDGGDVLKQRMFEIAPEETSLSLNTKCFEAAIATFGELVEELARGAHRPQPQTGVARSYYGKHDRPAGAGLLDWRRSAADLAALVRGLDFGRYANPLGAAKIMVGGKVYVVTKAAAEPDANGAMGAIEAVNDLGIRVATACGALVIQGVASPCGREIAIGDFAARHSLAVGDSLAVDTALYERLTAAGSSLSKSETLWVRRWSSLEDVPLPYGSAPASSEIPELRGIAVSIPEAFRARHAEKFIDRATAGIAAYLAILGGKSLFHVAYRDSTVRRRAAELDGVVVPFMPARFDVDPTLPFDAACAAIEGELANLRMRMPPLCDLVGRKPALRDKPELLGRYLSVAIEQAARSDECDVASLSRWGGRLINIIVGGDDAIRLYYDPRCLSDEDATTIANQIESFLTRLASVSGEVAPSVASISLLADDVRRQVLFDWNATQVEYPRDFCIHQAIEAQAARTPHATALVFENQALTYAELDERANRLAAYLRSRGVGPDELVGVCVERSIELVVAALAVHKAGGAYVPLDPAYPADRIAFMLEDAAARIVITHSAVVTHLPRTGADTILIDSDWPTIEACASDNAPSGVRSDNLAYVIYTSGSTGKPKGVMVEHRNAMNFFAGMDERIDAHSVDARPVDGRQRVWLAVTSLSFDISVLELFWTLSRGFQVVLYRDRGREHSSVPSTAIRALRRTCRPVEFSLFYFSADEEQEATGGDRYRLLLEGSKFGDDHGFVAMWTPERHFHAFGGLYPNPAVCGAAVAAITRRIQIRAGSVVLPLHHPARVAEEWAVVDNLSQGRVGLSVASGWQPNDFILRPENYGHAKDAMFRDLEVLKRLWRGERVSFPGATGEPVSIRTLPRPVQAELPVWITTAGNVETYRQAGAIGANLLTHLLGQSLDELAPKIEAYRQARAAAGFDPAAGVVSLMLHTFVGDDEALVKETVRAPLKQYLGSSLNLLKQYAWAFPAFKRPGDVSAEKGDDLATLTDEERDAMLEHAFARYYETSGLFGRPERCVEMVARLAEIGVNEVACLIDFGVPTEQALAALAPLAKVKDLVAASAVKGAMVPPSGATADHLETDDYSFAALVRRHSVTHLQCTPSMARMLVDDNDSRAALATLRHVMIGGEAFPPTLAEELHRLVPGRVTNMYGPTETTVWSSTHDIDGAAGAIPIGRPIANTQLYILDRFGQPTPPGVPGELFIGGDSVVRGYLRRPELTAERFVADPFRGPSARMYRTGDLAKWRRVGEAQSSEAGPRPGIVEFLGRTDHQVKIRGHRIELGEIEAVLAEHPAVGEHVVVAREDAPGDQRLVAYCVTREKVDDRELREHLRSKLPDYMTPSHVVVLASLPHTPNGKIDRKKLPAPQAANVRETAIVAAENDLEATLVKLWRETLGHDRVGVQDNFFDIGGHSLLVVRLHRRLAEMIDRAVSLTDLYRFPTIRALANHLSADDAGSESLDRSADRGQRRREAMLRRRVPANRS